MGLQGLTDRDKNENSFSGVFGEQRMELLEIPEPSIPVQDFTLARQLPLNDSQKSILSAASYYTADASSLKDGLQSIEGFSSIAQADLYLQELSKRSKYCRKSLWSY